MSSIEVVVREEDYVMTRKRDKGRTWRVSLPADVVVKRLLTRLIKRLKLDTQHSSGFQFVYRFGKEPDKILSNDKTLSEEGVVQNDVLILIRGFGDGDSVQEAIDTTGRMMNRASHFLPPLCGRDNIRLASYSKVICCPVCGRPYHDHCWWDNSNSCSQSGCTGSGKLKSVELLDAVWDIYGLCADQYRHYLIWLSLSDCTNESEKQQLNNLEEDFLNMEGSIQDLHDELTDEYDEYYSDK
ncbi:MAG: hypothetical protein GY774_13635 [Planctomycetes bacterium]|nr:hypothetical protein [Planctomycetota bacterium]